MNELQTTQSKPPAIPDDLQRELSIWLSDRTPGRGEDRMPMAPTTWHPEAEQIAAQYRTRFRERASPKTMADWMEHLKLLPAPRATASVEAILKGIYLSCRDLPVEVWSDDTLTMALRTFKWFPVPAEVYALLKTEADRLERVVCGLEAIAKAPRAAQAVEARQPYQPPLPPAWATSRRVRGDARGEALTRPDLNIPPPQRTVEQQIAILTGRALP